METLVVEKISSRVIHMSLWSHVSVHTDKNQDRALQQRSLRTVQLLGARLCVHARNLETAALFGIFCQRLSCTLCA